MRRAAREDDHEAQEVERERHDPQQRHRDEVCRDVCRHAQHEARRHERQQRPAQTPPQRQRSLAVVILMCIQYSVALVRRRLVRVARRGLSPPRAKRHGRARDDEQDERAVSNGPRAALPPSVSVGSKSMGNARSARGFRRCSRRRGSMGLWPKGRACARTSSARAARSPRERRTAAPPSAPASSEATRRDAPRRAPPACASLSATGSAKAAARRSATCNRTWARAESQRVEREHVAVAREQRRLKEEQARVPNGGRAAQKRQNHLPRERLNPEEQQRAQEQREREKKGHRVTSYKLQVQSSKLKA
jgi:hypothetical protein